jgi:putative pyruvate formate lyase activating enzyme
VEALALAVPMGLQLPIVYNTSGYETEATLRLLKGIVDIYLPDIKYAESEMALRYSNCADYVGFNRSALLEMWRQVGLLRTDNDGVACRGMIVRHLVLPGDAAGTRANFDFLAERIGPDLWVSLMNQYFPAHKALHTPPLDRKVTEEEYESAFQILSELEFDNGFIQTCSTGDEVDCLLKTQ